MTRIIRKIASLGLSVALIFALLVVNAPTGILAEPADGAITVTDGEDKIYTDKSKTYIDAETDVFVDAKQDVEYYVLSAGYVDVYYDGGDEAPLGSYFSEPFVNGAWVSTVVGDFANAPKTLLVDDMKVTSPLPAVGQSFELRVAAVKGGADTAVYGHQFIGEGHILTAKFDTDNNKVVTTLDTYSNSTVSGMFIIGIYKDGKLVYIAVSDEFTADSNTAAFADFPVDLSKYPPSGHEYKAFCWNPGFIPLAPAVGVN